MNSGTPWRRLGFWLFGIAAIITLLLGIWGNHLDAVQAGQAPRHFAWWYFSDLVFRTIQLFLLETNARVYPLPWPLEVARWLAATVAGVALLKAAQELFQQRIADWRLRWLQGHVVVCGLGRKGFELVRQLRARGDQVVVIEIDEGDDSLPTCRELGVRVLIGDARNPEMLKKAGVLRAGRLIAACKQDSDNIEVALQAWRLLNRGRERNTPLICHVHLIDLKLAELFKQHKVFACAGDPFEARIFSFYENAARDLLMRHPLDANPEPLRHAEPRQTQGDSALPESLLLERGVHLAIIGFGQMGESVALHAARIGHFASGRRLRLTIFDPQADERRFNLLARYPQLEQVCDIHFDTRSVEHPTVRQQFIEWAASERERLVVAICVDDDPQALSLALNLPPALSESDVPVFVRQSEQRGLATLIIDRAPSDTLAHHVTSFGAPEVAAGLEHILQEKLDKLARAMHERYLAHRAAEGSQPDSDPALQPWPRLDAALKSSNRQQADHVDVKLRAVGCTRVGKDDPLPAGVDAFTGFTVEETELLARMEHARWSADRLLSGWRAGPVADKQRRITEFLVPYDDLTEAIKQYDREAVLQIPDLVSRAGQRIVRLRRATAPATAPATAAS